MLSYRKYNKPIGENPMKIYLSGPMTGKPNLNKELFDHYERLLKEEGYEVVNPHNNQLPQARLLKFLELMGVKKSKVMYIAYMVMDMLHIIKCDAIVMLPGWSLSRGSTLECIWAMTLDKDFICLEQSEVECSIILYEPDELEDWFDKQF